MNNVTDNDVVIVSVGMLTAVGLSAPETAALVRSGLMRFQESSILDRQAEPFTLAEVPGEGLPDLAPALSVEGLTSREMRMLRLAEAPLRECASALPEHVASLPLMLALPESETTRPLDPVRFLRHLATQAPGVFALDKSVATFRGRAGGAHAVGSAAALVLFGRTEFAIAGGVDTFRDLYVLGTMDLDARVKTKDVLDGFIPGEGAGFVAVTTRATAQRTGCQILATLPAWGRGIETGHIYSEQPYRGDGLATAVQQLMSSAHAVLPVNEVYSSMNGENHWAKEWGVAVLRNRNGFAENVGMHHPADCYGDTGAAAAPLMIGLAALGIKDGYRRSPALVYGSSDRGERIAAIVV